MNATPPIPAPPEEKKYDIPTVSFRIITDDKSLLSPAGVHSVSMAKMSTWVCY